METRDLVKKTIAGLFSIACIALIVGVVFVLGVEKGLTEPKFNMTVLFREIGGLAIGAPVRISGVTVGTVSDIDFLEKEVQGRGVRVDLSLYQRYMNQLRKSDRFAIITEGVLGEKVIEISTDPDYHANDLSRPVIGEDPLDVQSLAETFGEAAVALLETSKMINDMTGEFEAITSTTKRLLNRIEQRVIDGNLFKVF